MGYGITKRLQFFHRGRQFLGALRHPLLQQILVQFFQPRSCLIQILDLFVLSDELSLVDCTLAPLFWRLPAYGIDLGKPGASVQGYIQRVISRRSFKLSLTRAEREMILNAA